MTIDTDNKTIQKRRLGRTEYQVTSLGLGTYRLTIDFRIPREQSLALLSRAVTLGINNPPTPLW